jgi:hypothetical protein
MSLLLVFVTANKYIGGGRVRAGGKRDEVYPWDFFLPQQYNVLFLQSRYS